jgi:hypothetical protein
MRKMRIKEEEKRSWHEDEEKNESDRQVESRA